MPSVTPRGRLLRPPYVFCAVGLEPMYLQFLREESQNPIAGGSGSDSISPSGSLTLGLNAERQHKRDPGAL